MVRTYVIYALYPIIHETSYVPYVLTFAIYVRNQSETCQKSIRNQSETCQKSMRNKANNPSGIYQKPIINLSETNGKSIRNPSEICLINISEIN